MAIDAGMIALSRARGEILFRYYGWTEPSVTVGYSQPLEAAPRSHNGMHGQPLARVRRETGGGVVDHRHDLTYALAVPRTHPAWSGRPADLYRTLHACLSETFEEWGIAAALAPCPRACQPTGSAVTPARDCFTRAEADDVVETASGRKLAGAAMRRHRDALLIQGSIERSPTVGMLDEPLWRKTFTTALAAALGAPPPVLEENWPDSLPAADTVARFAGRRWNEKR